MDKISLSNRKRIRELGSDQPSSDAKKDQLLAMKLSEVNQDASQSGELLNIDIHHVKPDPNQPRKVFKNIDSLADSIKENGIIQPVIVKPENQDGIYILIAGERRYRAAIKAGLDRIPAIIRQQNDVDSLIIQLLENDQREKVSPFEEADAISELIKNKKLKKQALARALGRDNAWVSMRLKLKEASEAIRMLSEEDIIDDVRTLYDLKKLDDELPEAAKQFIQSVRQSKIRGSYRQAISRARETWRKQATQQAKPDYHPVGSIEYDQGMITFQIKGQRHKTSIKLTDEQIDYLKTALAQDTARL